MLTQKELDKYIADLFESYKFKKEPEGLYDPLRYMIAIGGKRLRPRLCLLTYSLFNDKFDERILQPAAALEVFHSFTLLHDDIMDNSDLRRGKETVWKKWDENTAILSGDVMCIDSFARVSKAPGSVLSDVLEIFGRTAAQVCEGQQYDMEFEAEKEVSMQDYMKMIGLKTSVLLACSAALGALIGGASKEKVKNLYDFGYDMGLAFQVADDYLDSYGDPAVFGKPIGGDILNCKKTWLLIKALEIIEENNELLEALEMPSDCPEKKITAVKSIYDRLGIATEAQREIARLTNKALGHIEALDKDSTLKSFALSLVERAY